MLDKQHNDNSFPGLWEELIWRGLVKVSTDETELQALINGEGFVYYCGFDPTAPSLHVGNLVQLLFMRRLQLGGHSPLGLVGGSTGLIGDPRPTAERTLNDRDTVSNWVNKLQEQIEVFLDSNGSNGVKMVNNLDWFGQVNAIDFLRDIGKFFRVGPMIRKEAVRKRLESDEGISFTEFSYQILQASDFLELFRNENCVLQTGGSDQWGNITGGVELVRKIESQTVHAIGTPLIENSDGTKFGKSEGNAIWLNPSMTSPFAFFQFWLNTADADVIERLKIFTFLTKNEIEALHIQVNEKPGLRAAQQKLAFEVTALVHGEEIAEQVRDASKILFGSGDLTVLTETVLEDAINELGSVDAQSSNTIAELAVKAKLATSLGDARRVVKQNGLSINNIKVSDADAVLQNSDFLFGRFSLMRKGKKQLVGITKV